MPLHEVLRQNKITRNDGVEVIRLCLPQMCEADLKTRWRAALDSFGGFLCPVAAVPVECCLDIFDGIIFEAFVYVPLVFLQLAPAGVMDRSFNASSSASGILVS